MSHPFQIRIMLAPLHYRALQRLHLQAVTRYGHGSTVTIHLTVLTLTWWGDVVLRTPRRLIWAILVPKPLKLSSFPILVLPIGTASLATTAGRVYALWFLCIVVPRLQSHDICTSIAQISLRGVWRSTSPRQVSTDLRGKYTLFVNNNVIAKMNLLLFEWSNEPRITAKIVKFWLF